MRLLVVTKSRSGYGAHVVLTDIIRAARESGNTVDLIVSEHPLEAQKWASQAYLWDDLDPRIVACAPSRLTERDPAHGPYAYIDDTLLHDSRLAQALTALPYADYDLVVLDSWYVMYTAMCIGIHLRKNVYQLVQSDPIFEPTGVDDAWKAAVFRLMPWVAAKRIFVSPALARKFNAEHEQSHRAIGFFLNSAFLQGGHSPRPLGSGRPLRVVSMASDFNLPKKGLSELVQVLAELHRVHPIELKLISTVPVVVRCAFPVRIASDATAPSRRVTALADGDVYATCTTSESPGLAQAEAMAVGLPSVALDSTGNHDYFDGANFLMAHDAGELLSHLVACLDDTVRARLSRAARASMQQYRVATCVARLLEYARPAIIPDGGQEPAAARAPAREEYPRTRRVPVPDKRRAG